MQTKPFPQKPSYKGKHPPLGITCKLIFGTKWIQQSSLGINITSLEKCYKTSQFFGVEKSIKKQNHTPLPPPPKVFLPSLQLN